MTEEIEIKVFGEDRFEVEDIARLLMTLNENERLVVKDGVFEYTFARREIISFVTVHGMMNIYFTAVDSKDDKLLLRTVDFDKIGFIVFNGIDDIFIQDVE